MAILKKGLSGEPVRRLQAKLGVEADGEFGAKTETALKGWQKAKGLKTDGIAGPDTFMSMGLYELVLLRPGTRGDTVKKLQEKLGVTADGQYGAATEKAVHDYQEKNGLKADGMAGPATLAKMALYKEINAETVKASQVPASQAPAEAPASAPLAQHTAMDASKQMRSIWDTIKGVFK